MNLISQYFKMLINFSFSLYKIFKYLFSSRVIKILGHTVFIKENKGYLQSLKVRLKFFVFLKKI